jgi:hypothetical protein
MRCPHVLALSLSLLLSLLLVLPSAVHSSNAIIFDDFTRGVTFSLPNGTNNPGDSDLTYYTNLVSNFTFGLDWNGDASDEFSIAVSALPQLKLKALNNPKVCNLAHAGGAGVVLNATNPACNYTASWTTPFSGVLSITYNTGNSPVTPSSQQISIPFSSQGTPTIVGDPQFIGLRGQSYQVHGVDGVVYNIISEKQLQVNSRFVFLTKGDCPVIAGRRDTNCWSHPGSYLGELSFMAVVGGEVHRALIVSGSAREGFSSIAVDGQLLRVGDSAGFGSFSVSVLSTHAVTITTEHFDFELSNSDRFINQALRAKVALAQLDSHGLLGQTHTLRSHSSQLRHIEGRVNDYIVLDDIFGVEFVYNKFQQ